MDSDASERRISQLGENLSAKFFKAIFLSLHRLIVKKLLAKNERVRKLALIPDNKIHVASGAWRALFLL